MNVAYLFTFFLVVVIVLFICLPFIRQNKGTPKAVPPEPALDDSIPEEISLDLGRNEAGFEEHSDRETALTDYELEIEVAVQRARLQESTFSHCSQCGHRMQSTDRFCASCGKAR